MSEPLARHENRRTDAKLDFAHLERRGVDMTQKVTDQPAIFIDAFGTNPIRHPSGLNDGVVGTHVVDDADKTIVEAQAVVWIIGNFVS
jgi:hypothetical protein